MTGKCLMVAAMLFTGTAFGKPIAAIGTAAVKHETTVLHKKKKKKCNCCKKKCCRNDKDKPAAKDVLKDRNTKDPNIDHMKKPAEKMNPAVIKPD